MRIMFLSIIYLCGLSRLFRSIMDVQIWLKSVTLMDFIDITLSPQNYKPVYPRFARKMH